LLDDLALCGFISKYAPYNLNTDSTIARFAIEDNYLHFYYKFIKPQLANISKGAYEHDPSKALNAASYQSWLGYAFERMWRRYDYVLAKILGFSAVKYTSGVFYNRATNAADPGYQIDLLFDRDDNTYTICEIRYRSRPVGKEVIDEFDKKLALFDNKKNKTIHRVLVTASGAEQSLIDAYYFDDIISMDEFFEANYW